MRGILRTFTVAAALLVLVGCGDDPSPRATITVFAAASLTDAFAPMAEAFEARHRDGTVELNFAGSSSLREQILAGAPADVFAPADEAHIDALVEAGEVDSVTVFATNLLRIAVPAGNPAAVTGLEDFGDDDLLIGLCAEAVPCGALGRRALASAGVTPAPDTDEPDVRALLTKVEAGELDAGLVYVTDVNAADDAVEGIDLPEEHNVVTAYPIGTTTSTGHPELAVAFVEFVLSPDGQAILRDHGFGPP